MTLLKKKPLKLSSLPLGIPGQGAMVGPVCALLHAALRARLGRWRVSNDLPTRPALFPQTAFRLRQFLFSKRAPGQEEEEEEAAAAAAAMAAAVVRKGEGGKVGEVAIVIVGEVELVGEGFG